MKVSEIRKILFSKNNKFGDLKIGYLILKPNSEKHYNDILEEIYRNRYIVLNQYAIFDYQTTTMALHKYQEKSLKYIIPINRMYADFYSNYGILLLIAKRDITYRNFCLQVVELKQYLRAKFELSYMSYVFDTSELGEENRHQRLMIVARNGNELKKDSMNQEGTFMVFQMNEIHSPDGTVSDVINELKTLMRMRVLSDENVIPKNLIDNMRRYESYQFLKDML